MRQNPELLEAIREYLERRAIGHADTTVRNARHVLMRFYNTITTGRGTSRAMLVTSLRPDHVMKYYATRKHVMPQSRNQDRDELTRFFQWTSKRRLTAPVEDMMIEWPREKPIKQPKLRLGENALLDILEAAEHPRDRMLVMLGLGTVSRNGTIKLITWGDVRWDIGELALRDEKTGDHTHTAPFTQDLERELIAWRAFYEEETGESVVAHPDWYVIPKFTPSRYGPDGPKGPRAPQRLIPTAPLERPFLPVQRIMDKLGMTKRFQGMHTFRRSMLRLHYDELRNMNDIAGRPRHTVDSAALTCMAWSNHKEIKTFLGYIGVEVERENRDKIWKGKSLFDPFGARTVTPEEGTNVVSLETRRRKA